MCCALVCNRKYRIPLTFLASLMIITGLSCLTHHIIVGGRIDAQQFWPRLLLYTSARKRQSPLELLRFLFSFYPPVAVYMGDVQKMNTELASLEAEVKEFKVQVCFS